MNTADAKREGWQAGMLIKIQSRIGSIEAELACTDDVMQGVVSSASWLWARPARHASRDRQPARRRELQRHYR